MSKPESASATERAEPEPSQEHPYAPEAATPDAVRQAREAANRAIEQSLLAVREAMRQAQATIAENLSDVRGDETSGLQMAADAMRKAYAETEEEARSATAAADSAQQAILEGMARIAEAVNAAASRPRDDA